MKGRKNPPKVLLWKQVTPGIFLPIACPQSGTEFVFISAVFSLWYKFTLMLHYKKDEGWPQCWQAHKLKHSNQAKKEWWISKKLDVTCEQSEWSHTDNIPCHRNIFFCVWCMCPSGFAHYDAVKVVPYKLYFWSTFFVDLKKNFWAKFWWVWLTSRGPCSAKVMVGCGLYPEDLAVLKLR